MKCDFPRGKPCSSWGKSYAHVWFLLTCGMFLQVDLKKKLFEMLPAQKEIERKKKKSPECHSVCVCKHQGMSEGPAEWFLDGDCKFQARLLSISKVLFSPSCPRCPASQWRCSETQHTKWVVTCAAILFYLYWMGDIEGEMQRSAHPLLDEVWWLSKPTEGGCVIFTLSSEGGRETSLFPQQTPTSPPSVGVAHLTPPSPPKAKENSR